MLDRFGERIQDALESVEKTAERRGIGSVGLGIALAIGVVGGGIVAFIIVFAILIELVP